MMNLASFPLSILPKNEVVFGPSPTESQRCWETSHLSQFFLNATLGERQMKVLTLKDERL